MSSERRPTLRVTEIFFSLQGESTRAGLPTVFIRLTGCPLRCAWCDSAYAFSGGETLTVDTVLARVAAFLCPTVCVTGGEPLAQPACRTLLARLAQAGYDVSLETSGALDLSGIDPRICRVMDLKAPSSGETAKNRWENLACLSKRDEIKIVIADRADYEWARATLEEKRLADICPVLLSPAWGRLAPRELAEWILADRLPVRFQLQLHKILWGEERGR